MFFDNLEFGSAFSAVANGYYGQFSEKASKLGENLKAAAKNAYEHNWDLDSTEAVAAIMKQQAKIQDKIATAQSEAKFETLKLDFQSGDISQESFQNLIDATNEEIENLRTIYQQARVDAIAQAKLMCDDGSSELTNAIKEANDAYNQKIAELTTKGLQFENDAIVGAFSEISSASKESANKVLNDLANGTIPLTDSVVTAITQAMNTAFSEVAPETRKHIGEFYEQMLPSVEELKKSMQSMEKVPQAYANAFAQSSAIGAVGNNAKALKNFVITALSTVLPSDVTKVLESSKTYGSSFAKGIQSNENGVKSAAERLRSLVVDTLSKSININVPVKMIAISLLVKL